MTHLSTQAWQVAEQDFPRQGSETEQLLFLLNYAVLAPSGHNTQPWKFKIQQNALELWADSSRALPLIDPNDRELIISCGAALMNLRLAIHHFGYSGDIQLLPARQQPDLLARVWLGNWGEESAEERSLFDAIPHRHTNRKPFEVWDIPELVLKWLQQLAIEEGACLHFVEGEIARSHLIALVNDADHLQMADPNIRKELSTWIHWSRNPSDGLPADALGMPPQFDFLTNILSWLTRHFNLGDRIAQQDQKLLSNASALAILITNSDTREDWLKAGQALQKVLLRAQSLGIVTSFFNAPIQMPEVRDRLQQSLGRPGYPQVLLRLGYGTTVLPTPRRQNEDVLF